VFTLDVAVARERLVGLVVASALAMLAMAFVPRVERPAALLVATAAAAFAGGVWVIAATGPDAFRGIVGRILQVIFQPVFGLVQLTDPVEVTNTRFIVGYNGLADLCLVTIFCCGALLAARPRQQMAWALLVATAISLVLLSARARAAASPVSPPGCARSACSPGRVGMPRWPSSRRQ
jgi:hypothetical protein